MPSIHINFRLLSATAVLAASLHGQSILVKPYVQPGDGAALGATDVKVIAWMTDAVPGRFTVEFGVRGAPMRVAEPASTLIDISEQQRYLTYAAKLGELPPNSEIHYRVKRGAEVVGENRFLTRKTPDRGIRFVVTGDIALGAMEQYAIARRMAETKPEFLLVCGDITYNRGRVSEYIKFFWPAYGAGAGTGSLVGVPLMQSVPFYVTLGNHDVELADLAKIPDAFGAFYFFHPPRNAPAAGSWRPFIPGPEDRVQRFQAAASGAGYPHLCLYSFDNGPAHFLALDSDAYMPLLSADFREWIRRDLLESKARWKFVFFHHPGFTTAASHRNQQKMRLLSPLFEEAGVDVVFAGHVHNYQRSKPLRFAPKDAIPEEVGLVVRGKLQIDEQFDGASLTKPNGVIYVVTGAGGAELYTMVSKKTSAVVTPDPETPENLTAKFLDDRHSFTLIELDPDSLLLRQIDLEGAEVDRMAIKKTGVNQ